MVVLRIRAGEVQCLKLVVLFYLGGLAHETLSITNTVTAISSSGSWAFLLGSKVR
jgi:hypothetical protein